MAGRRMRVAHRRRPVVERRKRSHADHHFYLQHLWQSGGPQRIDPEKFDAD